MVPQIINGQYVYPDGAASGAQAQGPTGENVSAETVRVLTSRVETCSFSQVGAGLLTQDMVQVGATGTGITVNQAGGNLVVTSGTTSNAEFLARSRVVGRGNLQLLQRTTLSQRIANNNFDVWLGDLIGDALAFTINSATSVTVSFPAGHPFAQGVGQSVELGAIAGAAGVPGTATVASINGDAVTFTVAGWPATGSGTLTVWGWNAIVVRYTGTSATVANCWTRRRGWNSTNVPATVASTAAGHITKTRSYGSEMVALAESAGATQSGPFTYTARASSQENIPDSDVPMYVWLRALNGTAAPASTTTWTLAFWRLKDVMAADVTIDAGNPQAAQLAMPVALVGNPPVETRGQAFHDAVISGSPVRIGARAVSANYAAVAGGDTADLIATLVGALVQKPYSIPEADWTAAVTVTNTTSTAVRAAAGAGLRNYCTGLQYQNTNATATLFTVLDGAAPVANFSAPASMAAPAVLTFATPLRTAANAALNVQAATTGANLLVNAQGYIAP